MRLIVARLMHDTEVAQHRRAGRDQIHAPAVGAPGAAA
jgi:hypothetical protein